MVFPAGASSKAHRSTPVNGWFA
jgi:hypothetical protein